ncbi:restriction endonuclease subunit S [Cupriavidus basilensis]|uniref:restriction endonuclease subunit S n=1 Tax=Cupriavidus basilensis TaxID=68895 RepID=UPI002848636F|nr:restriction endonuclease subunit S [Cupriavidus basilensis]MDR3379947.1 restriction endonuclease subunit S [Cupriavidus basilensis]
MSHNTTTLGRIAKITSGGTPNRKNPAYWNGSVPWVKTAQIQNRKITTNDVDEWITQQALAESSTKIIPKETILMAMYGQGKTRGQVAVLGIDAAINQACAAILLRDGVDRDYVYQQLLYRYSDIRSLSNTGSQENLNADLIREIAFPLPPLHEQRYVAALLQDWDVAIERLDWLIAAHRTLLSRLREKTLRYAADTTPVKLHHVTSESTERNRNRLGRDSIMAVTKEQGMRPMREETISADIARYKLVRPLAFAYNPMRLNIGSIAMSAFERDVLVSPDYMVFKCDESKLLPQYLNHLRFTRHWVSYFGAAGNGSVRVRIYYDDLGTFSFNLPPLDVQRRIVDVLDVAALEIETLRRQMEALKQQKRGLMQKLLTGQWHANAPEPKAA